MRKMTIISASDHYRSNSEGHLGRRNKSKATVIRACTTCASHSTGYKNIWVSETGKADWDQIVKILVSQSKMLKFQSVKNRELLKNFIQGYNIIAYKFKRHFIAGKGIKWGRLYWALHYMQRRGDENSGKGDRVKSNRYFRAWINMLLYLGSSSQMVRVIFPGLSDQVK